MDTTQQNERAETMLKEAAEYYYKYNCDDHYFNGYYEGMKDAFALFLTKEKIMEIDINAKLKNMYESSEPTIILSKTAKKRLENMEKIEKN